ncbi:hypothetical protein BJV77DRAFT_261849 [Russula vinacea]|nr:hypothetical protein BJV77DRAFT_261849 [Russula vinacea]
MSSIGPFALRIQHGTISHLSHGCYLIRKQVLSAASSPPRFLPSTILHWIHQILHTSSYYPLSHRTRLLSNWGQTKEYCQIRRHHQSRQRAGRYSTHIAYREGAIVRYLRKGHRHLLAGTGWVRVGEFSTSRLWVIWAWKRFGNGGSQEGVQSRRGNYGSPGQEGCGTRRHLVILYTCGHPCVGVWHL